MELSLPQFGAIVNSVPSHARAAYLTLAATRIRVGEYLPCTTANLRPDMHAIMVPGTKTVASSATIQVDSRLWHWIVDGIPAQWQDKVLRTHWCRAAKNVGAAGARRHDLRHLYGQLGTDEGVSEVKMQAALRHATPSMTRHYRMQRSRGEVALAVGDALLRDTK